MLFTRRFHFLSLLKQYCYSTSKVRYFKSKIMNPPCYSNLRCWKNFFTADNEANSLKIMSYNILSQDLLQEHIELYMDIDTNFLNWEYRLNNLKAEIQTLNPDILCIQEMQFNHLAKFINAIDNAHNWEYIYKKKTGFRSDGCAIIYNRHKLKLLDDCTIEYYRSPVGLLNRHNVAIIAKFQIKADKAKKFILATTHLLYNPKRHDVRLAQTKYLLMQIGNFSLDISNPTASVKARLPILLTGDFNFEPISNSYGFITTGRLQCNQNPNSIIKENANIREHCLELASVFGEDNVSTFQNKWTIVDFIFYSANKNCSYIKIWGIYDLPLLSISDTIRNLPNKTLGSDHLCLLMRFSIENS